MSMGVTSGSETQKINYCSNTVSFTIYVELMLSLKKEKLCLPYCEDYLLNEQLIISSNSQRYECVSNPLQGQLL